MKLSIILAIFLLPTLSIAQTDLDKTLKAGELLVNGLVIFKNSKSHSNSKNVPSVCVKNKLQDKIIFHLVGKDEEGKEVKKELIIPIDGKECCYELPKGVYDYEILLGGQIFKKAV